MYAIFLSLPYPLSRLVELHITATYNVYTHIHTQEPFFPFLSIMSSSPLPSGKNKFAVKY